MNMKRNLKNLFINNDKNFRLKNKNKKLIKINKINKINVFNVQSYKRKYFHQKKKYKIKIIKQQNQKIVYKNKIIRAINNIMQFNNKISNFKIKF